MKGLILQVREDYNIIASDGSLYRVRSKGNKQEGSVIDFAKEDIIRNNKKDNKLVQFRNFSLVTAAMLVLLVGIFMTYSNVIRPTYAIATIDINPSIELQLDNKYRVISYKPMNKEAKNLGKIKLKGKNVEESIELVLLKAKDLGYLSGSKDDYVLVTTSIVDKKEKDLESSSHLLNEYIIKQYEKAKKNIKVNLAIASAIVEELDENDEEDISSIGIKLLKNTARNKNYNNVREFFQKEENVVSFKEKGSIIKFYEDDEDDEDDEDEYEDEDDEDDDDDEDDEDDKDGDDEDDYHKIKKEIIKKIDKDEKYDKNEDDDEDNKVKEVSRIEESEDDDSDKDKWDDDEASDGRNDKLDKNGEKKPNQMISATEALALALAKAGFYSNEVRDIEIKLSDDKDEYEISFIVDKTVYEYEIDPISGRILDFDKEDIED